MDDQDKSVLTRFFIGLVIVVVIIVLVWLLFFRHSGKKDTAQQTNKSTPPQSQTETKDQPASTSNASSNHDNGPHSSTNKPTVASASTQNLANTGAGQPVAVFLLAASGGTLAHYWYRRKVQQA